MAIDPEMFAPENWFLKGRGPRYQQLAAHIAAAARSGLLATGDQLPPERDLAGLAEVSRVTVRKAVAQLVAEGLIEQRRGAGSFIGAAAPKLEQSLSSLVSFTENMKARGKTSSSLIIEQGLFVPQPEEMVSLGLSAGDRVARVVRLRSADGVAMALESSSLPEDILPRPDRVKTSLYAVLRERGCAPSRAIQRVTAASLNDANARQLGMAQGAAVLDIKRTGYLGTGRPIEYTRGLYRPDLYDFVSELRIEVGR